MSTLADAIIFGPNLQNYRLNAGTDPFVLAPLSQINVFVGANNCGKSRFLRELAKRTNPAFRIGAEINSEQLERCCARACS